MAENYNSNLAHVAALYSNSISINVTYTTLTESIAMNPHYPSLFSISDVFSKFKIPNSAFKLPQDQLTELEAPFIAFYNLENKGNDFVLVTKKTEHSFHFIAERKKERVVSKEIFFKNYQNIVFVAEKGEESGEPDYTEKLRKESIHKLFKHAFEALGMLVLCLLIGSEIKSAFFSDGVAGVIKTLPLIGAKALGLFATSLLIVYEFDKSNSFVRSLCSATKQTNCDAVLGSKASKVLGISWGEIGFYYFVSSFLFLVSPNIPFQSKVFWLSICSALASPYIAFSLYYQWRVVKSWCTLCILVQCALMLEAIWFVSNLGSLPSLVSTSMTLEIFSTAAICILLPIVAYGLLRPVLSSRNEQQFYKYAYKRMLYNPEIFHAILQQQPEAKEGWQDLGITVGNANAENTILKICNPYCGPCAKAHPVLENIVEKNSNYKLRIVFTSTNHPEDRGGAVVKHLMAVASKGNLQESKKAIDDWYLTEAKDYPAFANKYPMNGELKDQDEKLDKMSNWCKDTGITHTPTIFINGRRLPDSYSIQELENIL